jgi:hypothetical protein
MRNVLTAAAAVLGIQLTACLLTAAYAWIPGVAQPSMWIILGSLFIQAALIVSAIAFLSDLNACATPPTPPRPPGTGKGGLTYQGPGVVTVSLNGRAAASFALDRGWSVGVAFSSGSLVGTDEQKEHH